MKEVNKLGTALVSVMTKSLVNTEQGEERVFTLPKQWEEAVGINVVQYSYNKAFYLIDIKRVNPCSIE